MEWPQTIPEDLRLEMEAAGHDEWHQPVATWISAYGLSVDLVDLACVSQLDQWLNPPGAQDRWLKVRECLVRSGCPVPANLPRRGEMPSVRSGH